MTQLLGRRVQNLIAAAKFYLLLTILLFWILFLVAISTQIPPAGLALNWAEVSTRAILSSAAWIVLSPFIILLDRRLPIARGLVLRRLLAQVPLSMLFTLLKQFLVTGATHLGLGFGPEQPSYSMTAFFSGTFQANLAAYWALILVLSAFDHYEELRAQQVSTAQLEHLASKARLENLRAQLNPHFMFNALNTISAYVERSPKSSQRMLQELREVLRLSLEHSDAQEIPLMQEIAFIEHYLNIQKARFEERFRAVIRIEPDVRSALVPTFILQPLVENAVLHGVARDLDAGKVEVSAWCENQRVHLLVRDDGPGLPKGWDPEHTTGIGIANTRERLRLLYGDRDQTFEMGSAQGEGVTVELSLPFHEQGVHLWER